MGNDCFYIFLGLHWGINSNSFPTVASTCKCLRMTYEHYDCLTNALLIPSDLNANNSYSAVWCRFGSQNGVFVTVSLSWYISSAAMAQAVRQVATLAVLVSHYVLWPIASLCREFQILIIRNNRRIVNRHLVLLGWKKTNSCVLNLFFTYLEHMIIKSQHTIYIYT